MMFRNGKLEETKHKVNQSLLSEFLEDGVMHSTQRAIFCEVTKENGKYRLLTMFIHAIESRYSNALIVDYVADFNYDIEDDGAGVENDKIDIFKHLSNGAKQVWNGVTHSDTYKQNIHTDIPNTCDKVAHSLIAHGYYI